MFGPKGRRIIIDGVPLPDLQVPGRRDDDGKAEGKGFSFFFDEDERQSNHL